MSIAYSCGYEGVERAFQFDLLLCCLLANGVNRTANCTVAWYSLKLNCYLYNSKIKYIRASKPCSSYILTDRTVARVPSVCRKSTRLNGLETDLKSSTTEEQRVLFL
jgi:hypothetical protein